MSSTLNTLAAAAYVVVLAGSLLALLRAFSAFFSSRVRASIVRHPILHAVWFAIAVVVLFDLLSTLFANIGPRHLPNHPAAGKAEIASRLAF